MLQEKRVKLIHKETPFTSSTADTDAWEQLVQTKNTFRLKTDNGHAPKHYTWRVIILDEKYSRNKLSEIDM